RPSSRNVWRQAPNHAGPRVAAPEGPVRFGHDVHRRGPGHRRRRGGGVSEPSPGPLSGIRVAEFGNLIAVPYAGMLLADLGAEVIKVEPPSGDLGRGFGPFVGGESVFFMAVNRGKQSLAIDPKHPDARQWLDRLVSAADVVVNNLR